jgi:cobalt/nickel transport system permease protein
MGALSRAGSRHFAALISAGTELSRGGPPEGFLQRCTPEARVLAAVLLIAGALFARSAWVLALIYLLCAAAALISYIRIGPYLGKNLLLVGAFALPVVLVGTLRVITPGDTVLRIGPVHFSHQGLRSAALVSLRALCAVSVTMLLMRSAGAAGVLRGLRHLRVSPHVLAAVQLALAHVHALARMAYGMSLALRSRTLVRVPLRRAYSALGEQGATLLRRSMLSSHHVHAAMTARGFEGTFPEAVPPARWTWRDALILAVALTILLLAVAYA